MTGRVTSAAACLTADTAQTVQDGGAPGDWGRLLLGFLERFGRGFDYDAQAVAVGRGGIVPKAAVPLASMRDSMRLCVEDPQTGRCAFAGRRACRAVVPCGIAVSEAATKHCVAFSYSI